MKDCKANVLGTDYKIKFSYDKDGSDGDCGFYDKQIRIRSTENMLDEGEATEAEKQERQKEVIRHELIHAFFYESGETDLAIDERLVNWIAVQSPKICKVFQELDLL